MLLYEYACRDCGHRFEVLQRMGDGAEGLVCPSCGHPEVSKQFSTFAAGGGASSGAGRDLAAGPSCGGGACGSGFS